MNNTVLETSPATLDPLLLLPDNYTLLMENDLVRVFDVRIRPGETMKLHANGPSVIYVLNDGRMEHTYEDGTIKIKTATAGAVVWDDAETHVTTNIGETDIHSIKVELKTKIRTDAV